jgi:flagellar motor switch protein FliN/FliY
MEAAIEGAGEVVEARSAVPELPDDGWIGGVRWGYYSKLPLKLAVSFPLQKITFSHLANLKPGMLLNSIWPAAEDVLISTGDVFLANVSFEPVGPRLGVRISGFAARPAPVEKRSLYVPEVEAAEDKDMAAHSLNDLWLNLSVCVGTAQVPLQEVLQWTDGDVVPLDRPVNAPVNILLKERIVGSGNLVLIEGFYAVQVTTVAQRSNRLPSC